MRKLGFIFAGQGQQFSYMGQDLIETFPQARARYEQANAWLKLDLVSLNLESTHHTQLALFVLEAVLDDLLKAHEVIPSVVCGLSLGEYGALYSSGAVSFEDGLKIIDKRGSLMEAAFEKGATKMAACIRTDRESVARLIQDFDVEICNVNTPSQIVIGGKSRDVDAAMVHLKENKVRTIPLKVATVSHMSLLKKQSDALKTHLKTITFRKPTIPFINNLHATFQKDNFPETLARQISETTELCASIELMLDQGVTEIIEVGPKGAISKFVKEINPNIPVYNIYDVETLKEFIA